MSNQDYYNQGQYGPPQGPPPGQYYPPQGPPQGGYYGGPQQPQQAYQPGGYQPQPPPQTVYVQGAPQKDSGGAGGGTCLACLAGACLCCCAEDICDCLF